jgi:hypothetical protein
MAISLRLTPAEDKKLTSAARRAGISKSEYLRQCLKARLVAEETHSWAYELGKDLFGKFESGRSDLSVNAKKIVREMIHAKARRSRRRPGGGSVQQE